MKESKITTTSEANGKNESRNLTVKRLIIAFTRNVGLRLHVSKFQTFYLFYYLKPSTKPERQKRKKKEMRNFVWCEKNFVKQAESLIVEPMRLEGNK